MKTKTTIHPYDILKKAGYLKQYCYNIKEINNDLIVICFNPIWNKKYFN